MNAVVPFLYNGITGLENENGLREYEMTYENGEKLILYQGNWKIGYFILLFIQLILLTLTVFFMMDALRRIRGAISQRRDVLANEKLMALNASSFAIMLLGLALWGVAELAEKIFHDSRVVAWAK